MCLLQKVYKTGRNIIRPGLGTPASAMDKEQHRSSQHVLLELATVWELYSFLVAPGFVYQPLFLILCILSVIYIGFLYCSF